MDSSDLDCFHFFDIYNRYCEIKSMAYACTEQGYTADDEPQKANYSREALAQLLILVESRVNGRYVYKTSNVEADKHLSYRSFKFGLKCSLFDELSQLKTKVELMVDFSEFSRFYDFVFFVCRENSQKNITVTRAVTAWRLVLAGRFRLLDPWCNFVEKNQRHNISEDTWRQVLAFSRCVHENLEGYDAAGAWPILIDDFVEHMYSIIGSECTAPLSCNCSDSEGQPLEDPQRGLKVVPGLKRKSGKDLQEPEVPDSCNILKRRLYFADKSVKQGENPTGSGTHECMEILKHNSSSNGNGNSMVGCSKPVCAVEGCLSKGFAGLFSGRSCLQFGGGGGLQQPGQLRAEGGLSYM